MRAEEFSELMRVRPFTPLRVHLTDGRKFDITHPDQVLILRSRIDIGLAPDPASHIMERVEHCSLLHVVSVEEVSNGAGKQDNGGG